MRSAFSLLFLLALSDAAAVDFNRDIQPLLADRCFKCHGPDAAKRKARLRLDQPRRLNGIQSDAGPLLSPNSPDHSELFRRLVTKVADDRMPPPDSGLALSKIERELIRRWIAEGANVSEHWSFVTPAKPTLPITLAASGQSPIDFFIREKLRTTGLQPAPPADHAKLLRRVSLDLTGLPPPPAETDAFLADPSPAAYERIVDRLLASERHGEHMAVAWLDAARYADTSGMQYDIPRSTWLYRDWVIKAYNDNLSHDQFITWQLAGDLLPNPSLDQLVATGFNRLHPTTAEDGTIDEEYRVHYVADRTATMGTVFLGLTLECARCHDHKYDPITQREFYSLFAFFNQMQELGLTTGGLNHSPPGIPVASPEQTAAVHRLKKEHARLEATIVQSDPTLEDQQRAWERDYQSIWTTVRPTRFHAYSRAPLRLENDLSIFVGGPNTPRDIYGVHLEPPPGKAITAIRVEALRDPRLPAGGPGRAHNGNAILTDLGLTKVTTQLERELLEIEDARADYEQPGFPVREAIDAERQTGWAIGGPLPDDRAAVFLLKKPVEFAHGDQLEIMLRHDSQYPGHGFGRFRVSFTTAPNPFDRDPTGRLLAFTKRSDSARTPPQRNEVRRRFRIAAVPRYQDLQRQLKQLEEDARALANSIPVAMVMVDNTTRKTRVLERGRYDRPTVEVAAGTPTALPPLPKDLPPNRLALARWLTSPDHPLTARVAVNRIWQRLFGVGLVRTPNDFGAQGQRPTHPRLLDWLAVDFREHGWDVKRLIKLIVTSNTYRQSARASADAQHLDPLNRLLSHAPRRRMNAEMIRDQALAISGLLHEKLGGPSVKPYQTAGLWKQLTNREEYQQIYATSTGRDLHRRSLYTYWKRAAHHPVMAAFDAPTREACTVSREVTTTPLQALALLHDPQFVEAARALGQRMLTEDAFGKTPHERIAHAFRSATGRTPTTRELDLLATLHASERTRFKSHPDEAAQLLRVGESSVPADLDQVELAATTMTARAILNLSETITLD